jgi:hypothetical protein
MVERGSRIAVRVISDGVSENPPNCYNKNSFVAKEMWILVTQEISTTPPVAIFPYHIYTYSEIPSFT